MPGLETESSKLAAQRAMHSQYVLQLLLLQRRAGFLCDITVNIEDKSFKAHKPLLAACSLYFRALFSDSESVQSSTLNLTKLSPDGFEVLLDYIYSGSLAITAENSDLVLYAANCLQMTNVVETCLNFIRSSFQVSVEKPDQPGILPAPVTEQRPPSQSLLEPNSKQFQIADPIQENLQIISTSTIQENDFEKIGYMEGGRAVMAPSAQYVQAPGGIMSPSSMVLPQGTGLLNGSKSHQLIPQSLHMMSQPSHLPISAESIVSFPQMPLAGSNPTHEALTRLMPYLVAKNARRPTLNEVRQLLLNGNSEATKVSEENLERFTLKQVPPALISAQEVRESQPSHPTQPPVSSYIPHVNPDNLYPLTSPAKQTVPGTSASLVPVSLLNNMVTSLPYPAVVASSTTNHATAHTEGTFHVNNVRLKSKDMQPFVLISAENNVGISKEVESSKGHTWSEDRSVSSDHSCHDATDLSGTPCAAITDGATHATYPVAFASPVSSSCSPRIQISPASTTSPNADMTSPRSKWSRTRSLECFNSASQIDSVDRQTSRSVGARPTDHRSSGMFRGVGENPDTRSFTSPPAIDHSVMDIPQNLAARISSDRISVEQATNAVVALFVGGVSEKSDKTIEESSVDQDESKLVIEEEEDEKNIENEESSGNILKTEKEYINDGFPFPEGKQDKNRESDEEEDDPKQDSSLKTVEVKQEAGGSSTSSTSPPPEDSFMNLDADAVNKFNRTPTLSIHTNSTDDIESDGSMALDLSLPRTSKNPSSAIKISSNPVQNALSSPPSGTGTDMSRMNGTDPKMKEALDALVMMQNSMSNIIPPQSVFMTSAQVLEDNTSLTAGFSRKPRRSSGGQTCQWPGCGRLFRHRNIYEEHQKLHEMGVPVTQLRKCYMGARVKKTARERLEEMRMVDGASGTQTAAPTVAEEPIQENGEHTPTSQQRVSSTFGRRRKSIPVARDGPDRKRVTVKDRKDHYLVRNQAWLQANLSNNTKAPKAQQLHVPAIQNSIRSGALPQQMWPGGQPYYTSVGNVPVSHVLSQPTMAMIQASMAQQSHHAVHPSQHMHPQDVISDRAVTMMPGNLQAVQVMQHPTPNNPAVAATLAALGIQLPVKRGSEDVSSHVTHETQAPTMTLDQLRRRIALRETSIGSTVPNHNIQHFISQAPPLGNVVAPVKQISLSHTPGNVTDVTHASSTTAVQQAVSIQMSVPNQYRDPSSMTGHGSMCS